MTNHGAFAVCLRPCVSSLLRYFVHFDAPARNGKKTPAKAASKSAEPDANELLRQKIMVNMPFVTVVTAPSREIEIIDFFLSLACMYMLHVCTYVLTPFDVCCGCFNGIGNPALVVAVHVQAKLRGEPLPDAGDGGEGAAGGTPDLPAAADSDSSGTGNNLKDKIAARLAAIRSDGTSPPLSPVSSVGGSTTASPGKGIQRSPDHVPAYKRCTTKEEARPGRTLDSSMCVVSTALLFALN